VPAEETRRMFSRMGAASYHVIFALAT